VDSSPGRLQTRSHAAPSGSPGQRSARFVHLQFDDSNEGLIHIVAELAAPTAYPAPDSRVTVTLYARCEDNPLWSCNVFTWITP